MQADVTIVCNVHMATCVLPCIAWLASVVAFWSELTAGKHEGYLLLTLRQVLPLFLIVPLHCRLLAKIYGMWGWSAVLVSPAAGWCMPLAVVWLRHARMCVRKLRID